MQRIVGIADHLHVDDRLRLRGDRSRRGGRRRDGGHRGQECSICGQGIGALLLQVGDRFFVSLTAGGLGRVQLSDDFLHLRRRLGHRGFPLLIGAAACFWSNCARAAFSLAAFASAFRWAANAARAVSSRSISVAAAFAASTFLAASALRCGIGRLLLLGNGDAEQASAAQPGDAQITTRRSHDECL